MQQKNRNSVAALALSATALVALVAHEGYRESAYIPVPGDRPTIGFGTTGGVQPGDTIDPVSALQRAIVDVQKFEGAIKRCVTVPLHQHEYDAAVLLSYNIGGSAFCNSTVVKRFNAGDHEGACEAFLMWNKFLGVTLRGLVVRREKERALCLGLQG